MKTNSLKKILNNNTRIRVENSAFGFYDESFISLIEAIRFAHDKMNEILLHPEDFYAGDISVEIDNGEDYKVMYLLKHSDAELLSKNHLTYWIS